MRAWARSLWIVLVFALISSTVSATGRAQVDYMLNCQGCHLPDGQGFPARNVPALSNHLGKFLHVDGGREFLVQVPGSSQSNLPDERLAAVLNWMLMTFSPNELPKKFQPYQADEIHRLRQAPLVEVTKVRQRLLYEITLLEK
jgi:mono/diheme cytochrome c family protein